jgi:hypothetical protein
VGLDGSLQHAEQVAVAGEVEFEASKYFGTGYR